MVYPLDQTQTDNLPPEATITRFVSPLNEIGDEIPAGEMDAGTTPA
jgi:hypothetical protein